MFIDRKRRAVVRPRLRRLLSNRCLLLASITLFLICVVAFLKSPSYYEWPVPLQVLHFGPKRMTAVAVLPPLADRVPCFGPRNKLLSSSPDDDLRSVYLNTSYPRPFAGSYEDTGLETTWSTFEGRYGPYGYGEDGSLYTREKVDWNAVNWGRLQNSCFARNRFRFDQAPLDVDDMSHEIRMTYRNRSSIPKIQRWNEFNTTRRTAIVLRAYSGYEYKQEDMLYVRSLIVEAALKTGGEYKVMLLVDIKDLDQKIFETTEAYDKALADAGIPPELHSITVLWDENLLASWYSRIEEHRTMWQVYQPLQLFALHYPEFDHYWQLELDLRFLGDAGQYLDALSSFARKEPRKQALERSTFMHMQREIGNYHSMLQAVNAAAEGGSYAWGPVRVAEIQPIGPKPPTSAIEDDFEWGVGEEADVIVSSFCANVTNSHHWVFKDWIHGFKSERETPRFFCPPAITRTSRSLLLAIHESQLLQGLRVPSEATPISFALWNGLKVSYPPQPVFWRVEDDEETRNGWWKGGPTNSSSGIGPDDTSHPGGDGLSFWWESSWPRKIMDSWMGGATKPDEFPWILSRFEGEIYAPNALLHPVKH